MNDKEAIEYIEQFIGIKKEYKCKPIKVKTLNNTREAIETILNLIEKQKAEIEKTKQNYKNLIEHITILTEPLGLEEDAPIDEMYKEINELKAKIEKKDKQIDLMANNLIGVVFSDNNNKEILFDNKEDIKQYFEKKAEENNNE